MSRSAFSNLQRARESLARARALLAEGRADPWQVAAAQERHDQALALALDEPDDGRELALAAVPATVRPAPPLNLDAVDFSARPRRGRAS